MSDDPQDASDGQAALNPFATIGFAPVPHREAPAPVAGDWTTPVLAVLLALACIGAMLKKLLA